MTSLEDCINYLVERGIPYEEAVESCMIALRIMNGEQEPMVPDEVYSGSSIFNIASIEREERYVLGIALVPNHLDTNGSFFPPTTVRNAAYRFMKDYQANKFMHILKLGKQDVSIVESYILPVDIQLSGNFIPKGTWMMGMIVHNDRLWNHIKGGTIRGLSIGAHVNGGALTIS